MKAWQQTLLSAALAGTALSIIERWKARRATAQVFESIHEYQLNHGPQCCDDPFCFGWTGESHRTGAKP